MFKCERYGRRQLLICKVCGIFAEKYVRVLAGDRRKGGSGPIGTASVERELEGSLEQ